MWVGVLYCLFVFSDGEVGVSGWRCIVCVLGWGGGGGGVLRRVP